MPLGVLCLFCHCACSTLFCFSQVDSNVEFDSIDIQAQDEEDKYFNEEDEVDFMGNLQLKEQETAQHESESDDDCDYESYEVTQDVRPGLQAPLHSVDIEDDVQDSESNAK